MYHLELQTLKLKAEQEVPRICGKYVFYSKLIQTHPSTFQQASKHLTTTQRLYCEASNAKATRFLGAEENT